MIRAVSVAKRKKHTHSVTTTKQTRWKFMQGKVWYNKICTVIQSRLKTINIAWQTFLFLELRTGRWNKTKTSELSGRKKMAATEELSTATRRTQNDEPEGSLRFNHVAKTERGKAGPQTIRTSLRKSFSLLGHRRNWVSAKDKEDKGKIYDPRSIFQDTIMQAPSTKDLTNSPRLVIIQYMSVIAETIAITAVIICGKNCAAIMRIRFALSNLAIIIGSKNCAAIMRIRFALSNLAIIIGSKNCAAIMRIRFALSNLAIIIGSKNCAVIMRIRLALFNLKREKKCSLHRKRLLKNIVSFTPIHKDEQIAKKNSKEIILMFRWIAVLTVKTTCVYHEFEEEWKYKYS